MAIQDANAIDGDEARFTHKPIHFGAMDVGAGVTDDPIMNHTPGYKYEVVGVDVFTQAITGACTVNVLVGGTTVLTGVITPVADDEVKGSLVTTGAQFGGVADDLEVQVTTPGGASLTGLAGRVWIRKQARSQG